MEIWKNWHWTYLTPYYILDWWPSPMYEKPILDINGPLVVSHSENDLSIWIIIPFPHVWRSAYLKSPATLWSRWVSSRGTDIREDVQRINFWWPRPVPNICSKLLNNFVSLYFDACPYQNLEGTYSCPVLNGMFTRSRLGESLESRNLGVQFAGWLWTCVPVCWVGYMFAP